MGIPGWDVDGMGVFKGTEVFTGPGSSTHVHVAGEENQ